MLSIKGCCIVVWQIKCISVWEKLPILTKRGKPLRLVSVEFFSLTAVTKVEFSPCYKKHNKKSTRCHEAARSIATPPGCDVSPQGDTKALCCGCGLKYFPPLKQHIISCHIIHTICYLRLFTIHYSGFPDTPPFKNQHFQIPILAWKVSPISARALEKTLTLT